MKLKKAVALAAVLLLCVSVFVACNEDTPPEEIYYNVTFDYNGGGENKTLSVRAGSKLMKPIDPEREDWIFAGWESEVEGVMYEWNFESDIVSKDLTVKAKWVRASSAFKYETNADGTATISSYSAKLENIRVPSVISGLTVTGIGERVFAGLNSDNVKSVTLPATVVSVGNFAFAESSGVKIKVEGALTSVGENAFLNCDGLAGITFGEELREIPYKAFANCASLSEISIPSSVTLIAENAFEGCVGIKTVLLCSKSIVIEVAAFIDCTPSSVFFLGSEGEWSGVSVASVGNTSFLSAKLWFYSQTEPTDDGNYWYFDSNQNPRCWVE